MSYYPENPRYFPEKPDRQEDFQFPVPSLFQYIAAQLTKLERIRETMREDLALKSRLRKSRRIALEGEEPLIRKAS